MMPLNQMQAAFEAEYPAASRARVGDTYGGAFGSMFIVWQQAVASCAPAAVEQVDALTDEQIAEQFAAVGVRLQYFDFSKKWATRGSIDLSSLIAAARAVIAAARPAAPVHKMDARAVSWAIHRNGGFIEHTTDARTADEAAHVGFRVENQYIAAAPVQAAPELTVWEGAMPESNGKSNFTAILRRKDMAGMSGMLAGLTLACSEYPDRVRYEADRARYIIGELAERPSIVDYDADKHSGYVAAPAPREAM